jgi:hypothetical protein
MSTGDDLHFMTDLPLKSCAELVVRHLPFAVCRADSFFFAKIDPIGTFLDSHRHELPWKQLRAQARASLLATQHFGLRFRVTTSAVDTPSVSA